MVLRPRTQQKRTANMKAEPPGQRQPKLHARRVLVLALLVVTAASIVWSETGTASRVLRSIQPHGGARTIDRGTHGVPPTGAEWWNDLDTTGATTPVECGQIKCLFGSKATPGRRGYTVSQHRHKPVGEMLERATSLARELEEAFGIRNTLRGEPLTMPCTEELRKILHRNTPSHTVLGKSRRPYKAGIDVTIQPVEIVPKGSILFGTTEHKNATAWQALAGMSLPETSLGSMEDTLRKDLAATLAMIRSPEGACLIKDFQVFVHPPTGRIYQFDFDRCFEEGIHDDSDLNHWPVTNALQDFSEALLRTLREHRAGSDPGTQHPPS